MARTAAKAVSTICEFTAPNNHAATVPPASAAGRDRKTASASFQLRTAVCRRISTARKAAIASPATMASAAWFSLYLAGISAWYSSGKSIFRTASLMSRWTSARGRPLTSATTSIRREVSSCRITTSLGTSRTAAIVAELDVAAVGRVQQQVPARWSGRP